MSALEPTARDVIAGALDSDALGAEPRGTAYDQADRVLAALQGVGLIPGRELINAAIALAWSDWDTVRQLRGQGQPDPDRWPEWCAFLTALDAAQPSWRAEDPEAASHG